jgi:L-iditol 2-dehydrogenase
MKAAFLTDKKTFEIREIPEPDCPDNGLILQVKTCGVCGSDLRRWHEGPPPGTGGIIPGHEVAGIVEKTGSKLSAYNVGDRIALAPDVHCGLCYFCRRGLYNICDDLRFVGITPGYPGGFAEKMVLTDEILSNGIVHSMPDDLSFEAGAIAEPCCSVLASHDKTHTTLGNTVVVMGAGPIGCIHVSVARSRGAMVIVSEPNRVRQKLIERFEPDAIVNPLNQDLKEIVLKKTNGVGADIVVCANPVAATQTQAVEIVRKGGTVVLFGGLPKKTPMTTLDGNRIHYGEIQVIGAFSYHPTVHRLALDLLCGGTIDPDLLITERFDLGKINEAFEIAGEGRELKVIINLNEQG